MLNRTLSNAAIAYALSVDGEVVVIEDMHEVIAADAPPIDLSGYVKPVNGYQQKQRKRKVKRKGKR